MIREKDFRWLIAQELPHLRRYARSLARNPARADDLVQDCLERAWRKRLLYTGKGSLRGWLLRMLYRQFLNDLRSPDPSEHAAAEPELGGMPPEQRTWEQCFDIDKQLDRLPPEQRAAICLIALEDLSYEEAARVLGISIGTLRSRLSRGRRRLSELWQSTEKAPVLMRVK